MTVNAYKKITCNRASAMLTSFSTYAKAYLEEISVICTIFFYCKKYYNDKK